VELEKLQKYENEESKKKIENLGLSTLWKVGKLEIESVVRSVSEGILADKTMEKSLLKKRAKALLLLGEIYQKVGKDAAKAQGKEDPAEFMTKLEKEKDKKKDEKKRRKKGREKRCTQFKSKFNWLASIAINCFIMFSLQLR